MKKNLLTICAGILLSVLVNAGTPQQRICGSMDNLARLQAEDPTLSARMHQIESMTNAYLLSHKNQNIQNTVVTIPVVFHVVYSSASQNISDSQCQAQLNQLNLDYARLNSDASNTPSVWQGISANTNVQFCLAQRTPAGLASTGIERRSTTTTSFSTNDNVKRYANGGLDAWSSSSYLNIWSCNLSGGVLGYAQFPGGTASTDGVVLLYSSIGSMAQPGTATPYHLGRTATHEVGHWLNLYHIWGDDGTACTGSDNCSDTPNQAGENYGVPTYPLTDGCSASSPGVMFMNYMDYTDDNAMNMFTAGQSTRMNALFGTGGSRAALLSSLGCQAPSGNACNTPAGTATSNITTSSATLSWTASTGAVSYNVSYKLSSATSYTTVNTTSTSYSLAGLTASTSYDWQVQTVCSTGSSANSSTLTFSTSATTSCGTPSGLSAGSITTTGATLAWTAVSGATSYNVQYKLSSAASFTTTTSTTNSKVLTGLSSSSAYVFQVQAVCASGTSSYSSTGSFTTLTPTTGCSDVYEPNSSSTTASVIPTNTDITAMIGTSTDNDYYKFTTTSPNTYIKILLTNLPGDYDIRLYNSSLTQLAISQNGGTTSETIIRNTVSAGTYYIKVYGYGGAFSTTICYNLRVNVGSTSFRSSDGLSTEIVTPSLNDFNLFPNPAQNMVNVAFNSPTNESINVRIFDMVGKTILSNEIGVTTGDNKFSFDLSNLTKGIYFVEMNTSTERIVKKLILDK